MLLTASFFLFLLIIIAITAVNVGRVTIVRNELQNGADATALAGALCLDKQTGAAYTGYCTTPIPADPINWDGAHDKSVAAAGANLIDGTALSVASGQVHYGYWNLLSNSASCWDCKTFSPMTMYDKPAVQVTGTRSAALLSLPNFNSTAVAVAVISNPGNVSTGSLIPYAIAKCMFDKFWDSSTNKPKIYHTGDAADAALLATFSTSVPQTNGQPWEIRIGSSYHYGTCIDSGQWTTFQDSTASSATAVKSLITNGNPLPIAIGDNAWISTGVSNSNYGDLDALSGTDVAVPVLNTLTPAGQYSPVVAFGAFHMDDSVGGSDKYVQGHFIPNIVVPGAGGIGPSYGAFTPPRLAQ